MFTRMETLLAKHRFLLFVGLPFFKLKAAAGHVPVKSLVSLQNVFLLAHKHKMCYNGVVLIT